MKFIQIKHQYIILSLTCFLYSLTFCLMVSANELDNSTLTPEVFIEKITNPVLLAIKKDKNPIDNLDVSVIVKHHILPYIDFQKSTRLAAGKHWENIDKEKQIELSNAFRNTLILAYSGAISKINAKTEIKILPIKLNNNESDIIVKTLVTQNKSNPLKVGYRLENYQNNWRIYDVNIEGIWLVESYKNQFKQIIQRNGVDYLIDQLNKNNS